MSAGALTISGLSLSFGGVQTLRNVDFEVHAGEVFAVIGPNGAGKSSLFNCVTNIYTPDAGAVSLDGESLLGIGAAKVAARGVARTFQNLGLFPDLSVEDNLLVGRHCLMRSNLFLDGLGLPMTRRREREHRAALSRIVGRLDLSRVLREPAGTLPYGVQKRVELGRALATDPGLLLIDEPVAGLNFEESEQIAHVLLDLSENGETTIVIVEHDMHLVMDLADRIAVLAFGELLATGTPHEIQHDPAVIAAYLGTDASELLGLLSMDEANVQ